MKGSFALIPLFSLFLASCVLLDLRPSTRIEALTFEEDKSDSTFVFCYDQMGGDSLHKAWVEACRKSPWMVGLERPDSLIAASKSDLERLLLLCNYTHGMLGKKENSEFLEGPLIPAIERNRQGKRMQRDLPAKALTFFLRSVGMQARTVFVMTDDAALKRSGSGHSLTEVWLADIGKWCMADAEFNLLPVLEELPLTALEFQQAITNNRPYKLLDRYGEKSEKEVVKYLSFIPHRLFYFVTRVDQRPVGSGSCTASGKRYVMLLPNERDAPPYFQRDLLLEDHHVLRASSDFYRSPVTP